MKASPNFPVTNPPVSMPCLHAISSLLEKDIRKRIGALDFRTFEDNPFFREINFVLLEQKKIPPIFIPSSEKTNFDATYDLEELLLEEAPLEARARRQKPRAQLKEDATDKEKRDEELHRMIETMFEPFDYTAGYDGYVQSHPHITENRILESLTHSTSTRLADRTPTSSINEPLPDLTNAQSSPSKRSTEDQVKPPQRANTTPNMNCPLTSPKSPQHSGPDTPHSDYFPAPERPRSTPPVNAGKLTKEHPQGAQRQRSGTTRNVSKAGGMSVVVNDDGTGSWSNLADKSATLPAEGVRGVNGKNQKGLLGFMVRKGGRARSPKPREAGVLGKEGARVVINNGR